MRYKAIILDLDNTIYPVESIADALFQSLFQLLEESGEAGEKLAAIKEDVKRKPFQWVARHYGLSDSLTAKAIQLLRNLEIPDAIRPFDDFEEIKKLPADKFLVTSGFTRLQQSKLRKMNMENDFRGVFIVDPERTDQTKKDIFAKILSKYQVEITDVLVVGDDPDSELKAAQELGLDAILYDRINRNLQYTAFPRITHFSQLHKLVK